MLKLIWHLIRVLGPGRLASEGTVRTVKAQGGVELKENTEVDAQ